MNRFVNPEPRTCCRKAILFFCLAFLAGLEAADGQNTPFNSDLESTPVLQGGGNIHAGIDSESGVIYLVNDQGIWSYSIPDKSWKYLTDLSRLPRPLWEFDSGYDSMNDKIYFWDRGVGTVYEFDLNNNAIIKSDNSHPHRNQFDHLPFIKDGTIHTFGGYGYWTWKNYITYFNKNMGEWSVQNVSPHSEIPSPRIVDTGRYIPGQDEFFTYGGRTPENALRADDQFTETEELRDIWKFSFDEESWHKIAEADTDLELEHYPNQFYRFMFNQNRITGSFYSASSNIWYIPFIHENLNNGFFFLPVNAATSDVLPIVAFEPDFFKNFIPTNFLVDQNESRIYVVGLVHISEPENIPIRIVEIPEETLIREIEKAKEDSGISSFFIYGAAIFAIFVLLFLVFRSKKPGGDRESIEPHSDIKNPDSYSWLKAKEKQVLEHLLNEEPGLDSEELEERIWPEIDSYDYRRKLRNETIKNINAKFKRHFKKGENIIIRIKDVQDKRRFLYKINDAYREG